MFIPIISHILLLSPVLTKVWTKIILPKLGALSLIGFLLVLPETTYASAINASDLILLTNKERALSGIKELTPNHYLTQAALNKAEDMLKERYFAHTTPYGKRFYEWVEDVGYYYLYAGENLAIDFATSEAVVKAWMDSATHRANVINSNYTDIGIVALRGDWDGRETTVVVQMFGSLLTDAPTVLGQTLENLRINFGIRKESLKTLASDLIMLPSIAGSSYFDIIVRPSQETKLAASNTGQNSIAASPFTKIAQGGTYQTLLKTQSDCCLKETTFALTEEKGGMLLSTPISYPPLSRLLANIKIIKFNLPALTQTLYTNLLIAGIISLLLLAAYEQEIRRQLKRSGKKA